MGKTNEALNDFRKKQLLRLLKRGWKFISETTHESLWEHPLGSDRLVVDDTGIFWYEWRQEKWHRNFGRAYANMLALDEGLIYFPDGKRLRL